MIQTKNISIIGYSGHSYVCIDTALSMGHNIYGYFDIEEKRSNPYGLSYLGSEKNESVINNSGAMMFIGIGRNPLREKISQIAHISNKLAILIHDTAYVSSVANIEKGVLVAAGAVVHPMASVSEGVICNTSCVVEHGCNIGAYSHIAPGAVLAGDVTVGKRVFIGANSTIKEGIKIVDDVIIGAGSVVLQDINEPGTYVGVPVRRVG